MARSQPASLPLSPAARRTLAVVAIAAAALCVYAQRQVDPDLYGYLSYGQLFVEHRGPTETDPFAYTSAGLHWITFEYLAQIALWMSFHTFGPVGLIGLKCLLGGTAIAFLWVAIRTASDDPFIWIPVFLISTSTASRYFIFRPQLFTFAFFALFVAVLVRFLLGRPTALWLLPVAMLIWVNSHGGFLAGLGAIGLTILLRAAGNINRHAPPSAWLEGTRPLILTFMACVALTFVNPWGGRLWTYVLTELSHDTNRRYITEWQPVGLSVDPWSGMALTILAVTMGSVGWLAERAGRSIAGVRPWQWTASTIPLIAMAYQSVRHVPLAAIWTAPVLALLGTSIGILPAFRRIWAGFAVASLVAIMLTVQFVAGAPQPAIAAGGRFLGSKNPCRAVTFLRDNKISGNLYNPLWWGSYITWEAYPAIRVAIDGRNISLFPDEMVAANLHFYSRDVDQAELEVPLRDNADLLMVPADAAALGLVRADHRWEAIYSDGDATLFVRADAAHDRLLHDARAGTLVEPTSPCAMTLAAR